MDALTLPISEPPLRQAIDLSKRAEHLLERAFVYVQRELTTSDRERTIKVPNGNAFIETFDKQLEVEVKADVIRNRHVRLAGASHCC